jgi:hypothetical protein
MIIDFFFCSPKGDWGQSPLPDRRRSDKSISTGLTAQSIAEISPRFIARAADVFWLLTIITRMFAFFAGARNWLTHSFASKTTHLISVSSFSAWARPCLAICGSMRATSLEYWRPWGIFASLVMVFVSLILIVFPGLASMGMIYMMPMGIYEFGLGFWLLIKGKQALQRALESPSVNLTSR